jgi:Protein of unknown function (DUF2589)
MAKQQQGNDSEKNTESTSLALQEQQEATELTKETIREIKAKAKENQLAQGRGGEGFAAELGSINFESLISSPINAAVKAQIDSSIATVNFIRQVGFDTDNKVRMVTFKKKVGAETTEIEVPLLSCFEIPSLRIETVETDFNVRLNSVDTSTVDTSLGIDAAVSGGFGPVKFKVSASYQRKSSNGTEVKREYSMNVKVRAVQSEIPKGLEILLSKL